MHVDPTDIEMGDKKKEEEKAQGQETGKLAEKITRKREEIHHKPNFNERQM